MEPLFGIRDGICFACLVRFSVFKHFVLVFFIFVFTVTLFLNDFDFCFDSLFFSCSSFV